MGQGNAWKWRYKGRFVDGTESHWLSEEEARDSFTTLQLDVFHARWETYHGAECRAKPTSTLTRKERDGIDREQALKQHPVGTVIWREFADAEGNRSVTFQRSSTTSHRTGGFGTQTEIGRSSTNVKS